MSSQAQKMPANDAPVTAEAPDDFPEQLTGSLTQTPDETSSVPDLGAAIQYPPPPSYHSTNPPQYNRMGTQPTINSISVEPIAVESIEEQPQPTTTSDGNPSARQNHRRCRFRIRRGCLDCVSQLGSADFWIPACISTYLLAIVGLFVYAIVLTTIRDNDKGLEPHDECYRNRERIAYLAGFLGWLAGIDHFVAHHWVLAVVRSTWLILFLVRLFLSHFLSIFIEWNPPLNLNKLDNAWPNAILVTSLWWPLDMVLWLTKVFSVPGCKGGGGF
ncbi:hypothetical protein BO86DRAFT_452425 [Aspergillus japonicus CBS 114.51]|uniref:Uncharacterized protein n=1 Tax=Aspergillus japonicus CBS 114.51 TaxID=1448312 RepID=A0A8T8XJ89_ASPJA|nr:hypothetical protein BO86DRAFT_452425 [Aspergillus japonicus CBS 114.51]RAH87672.1 hypothetical protein BO86DRAFT_452425 [Aspergillus japonicus CBS 114.51]